MHVRNFLNGMHEYVKINERFLNLFLFNIVLTLLNLIGSKFEYYATSMFEITHETHGKGRVVGSWYHDTCKCVILCI